VLIIGIFIVIFMLPREWLCVLSAVLPWRPSRADQGSLVFWVYVVARTMSG